MTELCWTFVTRAVRGLCEIRVARHHTDVMYHYRPSKSGIRTNLMSTSFQPFRKKVLFLKSVARRNIQEGFTKYDNSGNFELFNRRAGLPPTATRPLASRILT